MFDLGRQNYLIPIPSTQIQSKNYNYLGNQITKHLRKEQDRNKDRKDKKKETSKQGKWTLRQKMRYLLFLEENQGLFADTQTRKKQKIFFKMAKHIKSRKTSQCKSHHQKALKIHRNVKNIIAFLRGSLGPLKVEWKQFIRTEERVLINSFPEFNKNQSQYKVLQFSDVIKIQINTSYIESYF